MIRQQRPNLANLAGAAVMMTILAAHSAQGAVHSFELTGTVRDYQGQPVEDARVWLTQDRRVRVGATGAGGVFAFGDVREGHVEVVAWKDGYSLGGVSARMAGDADVDVWLMEPGEMEIRVINSDFQPLAGARLKSMTVGDHFHVAVEDLVREGFPAIRSDDEGFMTIPHLPRHSHISCIIDHRGYAESHVAYLPVGRVQNQDIPLYPGVPLRGRVTGPDGQGVERARVTLFRFGSTGLRKFSDQLTDSDGFYAVTAPRGDYHVAVRHPEYGAPEPVETSLQRDAEDNIVNLQLVPPVYIQGTVVDEEGEPMPEVGVVFFKEDMIFAESVTQEDGQFRLQVGAGEGAVRALPPDGYMAEPFSDVLVQAGGGENIDVETLELKRMPEIHGVVRAGGEPVEGVLISSLDADPPLWLLSGEDGAFSLRLSRMPDPEEAVAVFRAEHPLRFLRGHFEVDLLDPAPAQVALEPFQPEHPGEAGETSRNNMEPLVGHPAPEWHTSAWWNAEDLSLEDLRGRVIVLLFWGGFDLTGDGFHRIEEMRALHALYEDAPDVVVVGIHDASLEAADVEAYVRRFGIEFPVGHDVESARTFQEYRVTYLPEVAIIDGHGRLQFYGVAGRVPELVKALRRE